MSAQYRSNASSDSLPGVGVVVVSVVGVDDASVLVEGVVAASLDCVTVAAAEVFDEELLRRPY